MTVKSVVNDAAYLVDALRNSQRWPKVLSVRRQRLRKSPSSFASASGIHFGR